MKYIEKLNYIKKHSKHNTQMKLAIKLGVHVASLRSWFYGMNPSEENKAKIDKLYKESK